MAQVQLMGTFDRTQEDVGNLVELGHVNLRVPDQRLATLFYVTGLGLTRDPFMMTGIDNMWVNVGNAQFHLPDGPPQVLAGTIGLALPDLDALVDRFSIIKEKLDGTLFKWSRTSDVIEATCPWGNSFRLHPLGASPPASRLGLIYLEFKIPRGSAAAIASFYRDVLLTSAHVDGCRALVAAGTASQFIFIESDDVPRQWDGSHVQITIANFSGPHRWLLEHDLITDESNAHQYRFTDLVNPRSGHLLMKLEHEVRSTRHPLFNRALVNRG